jgi:hypothetical protein
MKMKKIKNQAHKRAKKKIIKMLRSEEVRN